MPAVPIVSVLMGTEDLKPAFSDSKERKWLVKQNAKPVKRIFQIEESSKTGVTSVVVNIEGDRSIAELGVYNSILSETAKLFLNEETQAEFDTWFKENPNGMHDKVFNKLRIRVAVDGRSNFVMMEIRNNE